MENSDPCLVDLLLIKSLDCKTDSFGKHLLADVVASDLRVLDFLILLSDSYGSFRIPLDL